MRCIFTHASGSPLSTCQDFVNYLHQWSTESARVVEILKWTRCTASELCKQSRPGAWLGDCLYTEWLVRLGKASPNVEFLAVGNEYYKTFAEEIVMIRFPMNSSSNNVGNQFEFLFWLALEERRYQWALSVAHVMARRYPSPRSEATTVDAAQTTPPEATTADTDMRSTMPVVSSHHCTLCNCWENFLNPCHECHHWTCKSCTFWCTICPKGRYRYQICRQCNDTASYLRRSGKIWRCSNCRWVAGCKNLDSRIWETVPAISFFLCQNVSNMTFSIPFLSLATPGKATRNRQPLQYGGHIFIWLYMYVYVYIYLEFCILRIRCNSWSVRRFLTPWLLFFVLLELAYCDASNVGYDDFRHMVKFLYFIYV